MASVLLVGIAGCQAEPRNGSDQVRAEHRPSVPATMRFSAFSANPPGIPAAEQRMTDEKYLVGFRYDADRWEPMYVLTLPSEEQADLGIGDEGFGALYYTVSTMLPGTRIEVICRRSKSLEPLPPFDRFHEKALKELCERKRIVLEYR